MLKIIKDILKTMGEGLTFADAGELRPDEEKVEMLARHGGTLSITTDVLPPRVVLASDETFSPETMEHAIALCLENGALLDLLYVTPVGNDTNLPLATVLAQLESEPELDFQVTRRHGDLLAMIDDYLRARQDIVMILINVNARLRMRAAQYQRSGKWSHSPGHPEVEVIDAGLPA